MRPTAVLLLAIMLAPALGGCLEQIGLGGLTRPDYRVSRTPLDTTEWNTDSSFTVQVLQVEPVEVRIELIPLSGGSPIIETGLSDATTLVAITIPDGTWTVTYYVGGYEWESFEGARFDTQAPEITGLETLVRAPNGSALLGDGAFVDPAATVVVRRQDGTTVSTSLPLQLTRLADGVHAYYVVATDPAGNEAVATVQVLSGSATELPNGKFTTGIVARYTNTARFWDLTNLDAYLSPSAAQAELANLQLPAYRGSGNGIEPNDPAVLDVVDAVVRPDMTTMEAALALYTWMFNNLEYDSTLLEGSVLLLPNQVILDQEDPADPDSDGDGLVRDGPGNGVRGGVCRDLAATYASLLRAAGVPSRLVAGYLAGQVNGFHAWVEVYGGSVGGMPAWIPVDVSGIDGLYSDVGMLQSFAVRLPDYLMLRVVTPEQEQGAWSTASSLSYTYVQSEGEPKATFNRAVEIVFEDKGVLCVDTATRFRAIANAASSCRTPQRSHIPDFTSRSVRVLDYGLDIDAAPTGSTITLNLVYPDVPGNSADRVEYLKYFRPENGPRGLRSSGFDESIVTGRATVELTR